VAETRDELKAQLRVELPQLGSRVLRFLNEAEFPPTHLRRTNGPPGVAPWLIQTKPADHLAESFGLAPELLVLLIPGPEAQARDIERAEEAIAGSLRLDAEVVLVLVNDRAADSRLAQAIHRTGRQYLFVGLGQIREVRDPRTWLRTEMRRQLGSADLFAPGRPVVGWDFFGRAAKLKHLRQHLRAGKPVGLYGLRKVGKTSLALRTLAQLTDETQTLGLHLDMQSLGPHERSLAGFMRRLLRALDEALRKRESNPAALGLAPDFGTTKQLRAASDEAVERLGFAALEASIDWARDGAGRSVVVFIDEYERLFDPALFPATDALSILDYLRGLVQLYPGLFNFVVAGLTRRFAAQSRIGAQQNPLFSFLLDFPLAGLERRELNQLLQKIGKRVGLIFGPEARAFIWEQSGGHPALAREYGRVVDKHVGLEDRLTGAHVSRERLLDLYDDFRLQVETTMLEIYEAVKAVDQRAPEFLAALAARSEGPLELPTQSVDELRRLGVIVSRERGWAIAIGCFADWLLDNIAQPIAAGA